MVGTIAPLVQRQRSQWLLSAISFSLASSLSAGLAGTLLAFLGTSIQPLRHRALLLGISFVALSIALVELRLLPLTIPSVHRSVPQAWWVRYGPTQGALAYGAVLGLGVTTVIPFASFYLLLFLIVVLGFPAGILVGLAYGFGRSLPVWLASLAIALGADARGVGEWVMIRREASRLTCGGAVLGFAIVATVLALQQ